jgi:tetratricopeptide (TPR) repeat protein
MYVLGKAYYYKGDFWADSAVRYLEMSRERGYEPDDLSEYLGLAYAQIRDYRASVEALSAALDYNDALAAAANSGTESNEDLLLLSIARSYREMEDSEAREQAQGYLQRCIDITRDADAKLEAEFMLARMFTEKGDTGAAEQMYLSVLEEGGESARARYALGELYAAQGQPTRARAEWRKALQSDPAYTPAREKLALL